MFLFWQTVVNLTDSGMSFGADGDDALQTLRQRSAASSVTARAFVGKGHFLMTLVMPLSMAAHAMIERLTSRTHRYAVKQITSKYAMRQIFSFLSFIHKTMSH